MLFRMKIIIFATIFILAQWLGQNNADNQFVERGINLAHQITSDNDQYRIIIRFLDSISIISVRLWRTKRHQMPTVMSIESNEDTGKKLRKIPTDDTLIALHKRRNKLTACKRDAMALCVLGASFFSTRAISNYEGILMNGSYSTLQKRAELAEYDFTPPISNIFTLAHKCHCFHHKNFPQKTINANIL